MIRRSESGQAAVLAVVMITALLGMAALVVDAGAWFRAHRQVQAVADAAALAGAQALPYDPSSARSLALEYSASNGGDVASSDITFETQLRGSDTIVVHAHQVASGFFSKLFGIDTVSVGATAKARAATPGKAFGVAPIGVDKSHPDLSGPGCPCWGHPTTLDLEKVGPGAFRILNLDGSKGGTGPSTLGDWIDTGYNGYLGLGWYGSDPGAKFNSSQVDDALSGREGTELLFPVYDTVEGQGANFDYNVVGWAGFHLTSFDAQGSHGHLYGWFTHVVWKGIQDDGQNEPDLGAYTVSLIQ